MANTIPINRTDIEQIVRSVVLERLGRRSTCPVPPSLVVHASARHMHVSREDLDQLFGKGYELTVDRPLYQPGNYAAKEMVTLIGPRSRLVSNLRILGPIRPKSQVELAYTDAISLGLDTVPIRISGDIEGTPGCFIMGPRGMVELKEGVIRAAIHVHMNSDEAAYYGVKHRDVMKLRVGGDAGVTFNRVHVRVDKNVKLNVHMDTDEANACGLHLAKDIELFK
jgi:putative phosphotransacetylase